MKRITCKLRTLAVMLAVFSSVAAMGQPQTQQEQQKKDKPEWLKELSSRITLSGYAQAGWSYQNPNNKATNAYNLKRTLLWAKARITDRWSFCLCMISRVWYRSSTPTIVCLRTMN